MPTALNNVCARLKTIASTIYQTPVGKVAIALNTVVTPTVNEDVTVTLFKESATGDRFTVARKVLDSATLDNYSPKLDKLVLLPGEKLIGKAVIPGSNSVRASGFFGIPSYYNPLLTDSGADISFSVAERS